MVRYNIDKGSFLKYQKAISDIFIDNFFSSNDSISGTKVVEFSPIKQVNFFVLKVLFDRWQDETLKFRSPYFDYDKKEVSNALKSFVNILSRNISIKKDDFRPLLEIAVTDTLNLILTPDIYYQTLFSKSNPSLSQTRIVNLSKYIKTFTSLHREIRDGLTETSSLDNGVKSFVDSVVQKLDLSNEQEVLLDEFNNIKSIDFLLTEDEFSSNNDLATDDDENAFDFGSALNIPDENVNTKASETQNIVEEEPITVNDQFQKTTEEVSISEHHANVRDSLSQSININQRYMFINDLFDGDEAALNNAIQAIDEMDSFDQSVELLVQQYSKKFNWDMSSDEVKELLKIIFKKYRD